MRASVCSSCSRVMSRSGQTVHSPRVWKADFPERTVSAQTIFMGVRFVERVGFFNFFDFVFDQATCEILYLFQRDAAESVGGDDRVLHSFSINE